MRPYGLFGGQKSGSSTGLLHYCTFGLEAAKDAQNVSVDTAHRKDKDQQNLSTRSSADADNRLDAFTITGAPVNTTVTYNEAIFVTQH